MNYNFRKTGIETIKINIHMNRRNHK